MNRQLNLFGEESTTTVLTNVASVPQRSPFRYPGGKTWLIPVVRQWLKQERKPVVELIEPFAGGGIVSLTAAFEKLSEHIIMIEKDEEIAAVWEVLLNDKNKWLADKIISYNLTIENIRAELGKTDKQLHEVAFCTILKNRIFHGGILAKGSGMIKNGENGKGITSRWYPKTLHDRIIAINYVKEKIQFIAGDAFDMLEEKQTDKNAYFFIDPPYTVAGKRLYNYSDVDHERIFALASKLKGKFMLTYDNTEEIRQLANKYHLAYKTIPMKTTHHFKKMEMIISDNFGWWEQ
ncbi:MAG: DNA adenine methylase [Odoribacteraceae bacterium]|jgi:DNA adenine methylase|nr:DNA adenine methylase [Odoribacteraceae bacterium]